MFQIQNLTNDARQRQTLVMPDGTRIVIALYFVPMQYGWFITEISSGDFVLNGIRLCNSPDLLYQFKNQISFGLACFSDDNREPSLQDDLATGATRLFILSADEVEQYSEILSG